MPRFLIFSLFFVSTSLKVSLGQTQVESIAQYRVSVISPITTQERSFGIGHVQGIQLAVDEHNKSSTDFLVELKLVDNQADPSLSAKLAKQICGTDAVAILGPCTSSCVKRTVSECSRLRDDQKVPIVFSTATATSLTDSTECPSFRCNVSDRYRISQLLAEVVKGFETENIILCYEQDTYGNGLLEDAKLFFKGLETPPTWIEIPHHRNLSAGDANEIAEEIRDKCVVGKDYAIIMLNLDFDAISLGHAVRLQRELAKTTIYTIEASHELLRASMLKRSSIRGIRVISAWDPSNKRLSNFKSAFDLKYHEEPTFAAALGHDSAKVLIEAIRLCKLEGKAEPSEIRRGLAAKLIEASKNLSKESLALDADHNLASGEYSSMTFKGYQVADGELLSWDDKLPPLARDDEVVIEMRGFPFPSFWMWLLLYACAVVGSWARAIAGTRAETTREYVKLICKPQRWFLDPLFAIVLFGWAFLCSAILDFEHLKDLAENPIVKWLSPIVTGFFVGYAGVHAINKTINKFADIADVKTPPSTSGGQEDQVSSS